MSIEDFKNLTDEEKDKLRMEYVRETFDPAKFDHAPGKTDLRLHDFPHLVGETAFFGAQQIEFENMMGRCEKDIQRFHPVRLS